MIVWGVFEKNNNNRLCVAGTVEVTKNCREKAEKSYFLAWQKKKIKQPNFDSRLQLFF